MTMDICLTCGSLIPAPGVAYGYSGQVCHCYVPPRVQRPASRLRECITHHHACDCREERMRLLERVAKEADLLTDLIDIQLLSDSEAIVTPPECGALIRALADLDALGEGE